MTTIPDFSAASSSEVWPDAEFDFPDGDPIQASDVEFDKEDDEDWDMEMDLGKTGGAKAHAVLEDMAARCVAARSQPLDQHHRMVTIRPPITSPIGDDDDEGVSTIKVSALPKEQPLKPPPATIDEDFEDDFVIPSEVMELSLCPSSLAHRSSKSSMEWGDRDHTASSQSSDAFSTFGFTDNSTPSSYTSASQPETETEDEDEEDILDGLVVPSGLFESGHGAKKLAKLLETKKATNTTVPVDVSTPDPEDDFEAGLVLNDDMELSPSRLMLKAQNAQVAVDIIRSKSVPPRASLPNRPPSRLKGGRARSPNHPPVSSIQQFRKLPAPPSSLLLPPSSGRHQTYSQALTAVPSPSSSTNPVSPKFGTLRTQKSHSGLKPPSPPSTRRITRKASLPALPDNAQASGSGSSSLASSSRYNAPTASSRAKIHTYSTSRISAMDYVTPPTRPSTPSSNPAALRLTMPTSSSRLKARAPISGIFPQSVSSALPSPRPSSISPIPSSQPIQPTSRTRSNSSTSGRPRPSQSQIAPPAIAAPKVLKRPKRLRAYGDGTELDAFEDLPLDREKEGRYRVQVKGRVPGASFNQKDEANSNTIKVDRVIRRMRKPEGTPSSSDENTTSATTLKRTGHIGLSSNSVPESSSRKKKSSAALHAGQTKRKPTLIRHLGGASVPKVVGEMKWNPQTLRWEGNDQVLRDFDVGMPARPALITQLTGSSIGSPVGTFASGARVVGNMFFDPARMCWISTLAPEDDEPDVFADLADDEDDEWEAKGATIRPGQQQQSVNDAKRSTSPSRTGRSRAMSETESDRCSRGSTVFDVDDGFVEKCRLAEERHRVEMKGWMPSKSHPSRVPERAFLHEIRALATRQY